MRFIFILTLLISTAACNSESTGNTTEPESFDSFNLKFHSDTTFQLSRIAFPIGGKFADSYDQYEWTKQNWQFLNVPVMEKVENPDFLHSYERTDSTVTEKYWIDNSGFKVEARFKMINGKWHLVYYDDWNL